MKLKSLLLIAFAAFLAVAAPRSAQARVDISFDFFHDTLSPHGEWLEVGDYGMCWRPAGVDEDWSPYSDGYWTYTDAGWTWVSYEDYGGIVYHYGRWVSVEDEGWCWVPGYEWGPAWVSWRNNDDYTGWAPLPPEARWRRDTGISVWVDTTYDIGPSHYNFCQTQDFGAPFLRPVIISRARNVTIIQNTVNITNITYNTGSSVVFNGGPDYVNINRHARRQIPTLKLVQNNNITINNITQVNNFKSVQQGNQLTVVAPTVLQPAAPMERAKPAKVIAAGKVNRGWGGMRDPQQQEQIRAKMKQDTKGLTPDTAPAKAVQAVDLKVLPEKADPTAPSPIKNAKDRPVVPGKRGQAENAEVDAKPVEPVTPGKGNDPRMGAKPGRGKAAEDAPAAVIEPPVAPSPIKNAKERPMLPGKRGQAENAEVDTKPVEPVIPGKLNDPRMGAKPGRGKAAEDAPAVVIEPPVAPVNPVEPARIVKDRKLPPVVPPSTPVPVQRPMPVEEKPVVEQPVRVLPVKPQPFKAQPDGDAAEKARAAAESRKSEAAERQRMMLDQKQQQKNAAQQEAVREKADLAAQQKAAAAQDAARARMQQQKEQQDQAATARRQQAEGAQRQQMLRDQQAAKQQQAEAIRQNQAAQGAKQQQLEAARDQQAAKAARQQQMEGARQQGAANAAKQQQLENSRQQQAERSNAAAQQRQMMLQQQQQQRQPPVQRQLPPQQQQKGKRPLTPEEAAALKEAR